MDSDGYLSSSPSITEEEIDFQYVYALRTFVATEQGQANVVKGDSMLLLNDTNSYWWLVRLVKDSSVGFLPAEHVETPRERLARLNKHRNGDISSPASFSYSTFKAQHPDGSDSDDSETENRSKRQPNSRLKKPSRKGSVMKKKSVSFTETLNYVSASEFEYTDEEPIDYEYSDFESGEEEEEGEEAEEQEDEVEEQELDKSNEKEIPEPQKQESEDKKSNGIFSLMSRNKRKSPVTIPASPESSHSKSKSTDTIESAESTHEDKPKHHSLLTTKSSTESLRKQVSSPISTPSSGTSGISGLFKRITRKDSLASRHESETSDCVQQQQQQQQQQPKLRIEPVQKSKDSVIEPPKEVAPQTEVSRTRASMFEPSIEVLAPVSETGPRRRASDGANSRSSALALPSNNPFRSNSVSPVATEFDVIHSAPTKQPPQQEATEPDATHLAPIKQQQQQNVPGSASPTATGTAMPIPQRAANRSPLPRPSFDEAKSVDTTADLTTESSSDYEERERSGSAVTVSTTLSSPALVDDRDDSSTGTADENKAPSPSVLVTASRLGSLSSLLADENKIHPEIVEVFRETSIRLDNMSDKLEALLNTYRKPARTRLGENGNTGIYTYEDTVASSDIYN